jgi:hypothetical protein
MILNMNLSEDAEEVVLQGINDFIDSAELADLKVGAQLDDTDMVNGLTDLLESGALTVEQMNGILEGIGWEPEITYAEMPLSEVQSFSGTQEQEIMVPEYTDGMITGYKKTTVSAA